MSSPVQQIQSLEQIYTAFIENMCKVSGKPEMAKPLIEGFGAYCNAHKTCVPMIESLDGFFSDPLAWIASPVSVYLTVQLYKTVFTSVLGILFYDNGENADTKAILSRIESEPDKFKEYLCNEIKKLSGHHPDEMTDDELKKYLTDWMSKWTEVLDGIPLTKAISVFDKEHQLPPRKLGFDEVKSGYGYTDEEVKSAGGFGPGFSNLETHGQKSSSIIDSNDNAHNVYVYKNRAIQELRTIPKYLIQLYMFIIRGQNDYAKYMSNTIARLISKSGTLRRKFDDIWNNIKEHWGYDNTKPSNFAEQWLRKSR